MPYLLLKWLHILLAIAAVGANMTYAIWLARGARNPQHLDFALRGVKILDDRLANPAYGLLLVTGVVMVFMAGYPITTPWILIGLVLYIAVVLIGLLGYTPALRLQIQLLESRGPDSPEYRAASRSSTTLAGILAVLIVAITFLMVTKPSLWAA